MDMHNIIRMILMLALLGGIVLYASRFAGSVAAKV